MKQMHWLLGLLLAVGPGCVGLPRLVWDQPAPPRPAVEVPDLPPPVVQVSHCNETNYVQKTDAVREELDYAADHSPVVRPVKQGSTDGKE